MYFSFLLEKIKTYPNLELLKNSYRYCRFKSLQDLLPNKEIFSSLNWPILKSFVGRVGAGPIDAPWLILANNKLGRSIYTITVFLSPDDHRFLSHCTKPTSWFRSREFRVSKQKTFNHFAIWRLKNSRQCFKWKIFSPRTGSRSSIIIDLDDPLSRTRIFTQPYRNKFWEKCGRSKGFT